MIGSVEKVLRNYNIWVCLCHCILAGFKLAIGSVSEAAVYATITIIHGLCARAELRGHPPHQR
jgi:hypothetical protein